MRLALLPGLLITLAGLTGASWSVAHAPTTHAATLSSRSVGGFLSIAAQSATTATVTVSATQATTSTTTAQNTPVPLSTATPPGTLRLNPLDWNFLTSPASAEPSLGALGPFAWVFAVAMLLLLGVSGYFYYVKRNEWKRTNPVLRRAANRFAPAGMWTGALGILFAIFRVVALPFFNLRFWLYLFIVAVIALAAWIIYWYRDSYPSEIAKFEKTQRARQYMPTARKGSVRAQPVPNNRPVRPVTPPGTAGGVPSRTAGTPGAPPSAPKPGGNAARKRKRK